MYSPFSASLRSSLLLSCLLLTGSPLQSAHPAPRRAEVCGSGGEMARPARRGRRRHTVRTHHLSKFRFLAVSGMARGSLEGRMEAMPDHLLCAMACFVDHLYPCAENPFFSLRHRNPASVKRFLTGLPSADLLMRSNAPRPSAIPLVPRGQGMDTPERLQIWAFLLQAGDGKEKLLCCLYDRYSGEQGTTELVFARLPPPAAKPEGSTDQPATSLQKGKQDRPARRDKPPVWERLRQAGGDPYRVSGRVARVAAIPQPSCVYVGIHNHSKGGGLRTSLIRFTLQLPEAEEETIISSGSKSQVARPLLIFPEPTILHADGKRELMALEAMPGAGGVFSFGRASSSEEDLAEEILYFSGPSNPYCLRPLSPPVPRIGSSALVTTYSLDYHCLLERIALYMGFTNGTALRFGSEPTVPPALGFTSQRHPGIQFSPRKPVTAVLSTGAKGRWDFIFAGGQGKGRKHYEDGSLTDVCFPDTQGWGTIRHLWYLVPEQEERSTRSDGHRKRKKEPAELLIGYASRPTKSIAQGRRNTSADHHFIIWDLSRLFLCPEKIQASAREAEAVVPASICYPVYWFKDQLPERPDMPEHVRWDLACIKLPEKNRLLVGHLVYPL